MIATYPEVRVALQGAAAVLEHPTKVLVKRGQSQPHKYGSSQGAVVYQEGGAVGVAVTRQKQRHYYVARGESHESSAYALAHHLDLKIRRRKESGTVIVPDSGVTVEEVSADEFRTFCTSKG